jgi:hypothetical protein
MTRCQYALYIIRRCGESLLVFALFAALAHFAQQGGFLRHANHAWMVKAWNTIAFWRDAPVEGKPLWFRPLDWWTWPAVAGIFGYLFFGPKQSRPIYLKIPGVMYCYAGVRVDRNAGCRGGLVTGSTGSGKTQVCINPRNHSIAINECGVEKPGWKNSKAREKFESLKATFREQTRDATREMKGILREREALQARLEPVQDRLIDILFDAINRYQIANPRRPFSAALIPDGDEVPPELSLEPGGTLTPDNAIALLTWARNANRLGDISRIPQCNSTKFQAVLNEYADLVAEDNALNERYNLAAFLVQLKRTDIQKFADGIKSIRYRVPPYGALVIGAKGNEWQATVPMLSHFDRDEDIGLLQTRPENAPEAWSPPAKFNLISYSYIPASSYAQLLMATYMTISRKSDMDYFDNAARDQIGFGIDLLRAINEAQAALGVVKEHRTIPNLTLLCELFTTLAAYKSFMERVGASPISKTEVFEVLETQPDGSTKRVPKERTVVTPSRLKSARIRKIRAEIEGGYWGLAPETQQSVMGSIRNCLVPFTEPDVQEVFCAENTFDLREIEFGKVVCLSMPPKFSVQRQFVGTMMKNLVFFLINERFSLSRDDPRWKYRNLVIVDSDEHQISAGTEDARVDIIREANGTLYAASQTRPALYKAYGGKDNAVPILANLRNLWLCQSGHDECASDAAKIIGESLQAEVTHSKSGGSTSWREKPIVSPAMLKQLAPFFVYWLPAEGKWLYKQVIAMPVTPDGQVPSWWFGDWNILHWLAKLLLPASIKLPGGRVHLHPGRDFLPPWKARAPLRAQIRHVLGFDGTFIVIEKMKRKTALKMARPK